MRAACVFVPGFPFQVEAHRSPQLRDRSVLIVRRQGARPVVLDSSPSADIPPGTPLPSAQARCKDAVLLEADPPAYEEAWNAVLDRLERCSPVVENTEIGTAFLDLTGLDALYGTSEAMATAMLSAVPAYYGARLGMGIGKFPAQVAAYQASPGQARLVPDDTQCYLAPMPVDMLPVSWAVRVQLHQYGLHTLGDLAERPIGPLQAQFGKDGALAWQLARGQDARPIVPRPHDATIVERLEFQEATTSVGAIVLAANLLLGKAFSQAKVLGRAARAVEITADLLGAGVWHRRLTGREPYCDKASALSAIKAVLDGLIISSPVTGVAIELAGLVGVAGKQSRLFNDVRAQQQLGESIRQLSARLGTPAPVFRYQEMEPWSRIPERRGVLVPFAS